MLIFIILALVIAIFAVVFALQNTATATITFLFWQFHGSLALVLIIALLAGMLISFLAYLPNLLRGHLSGRKLRKRLTELEGTLSDHKQRLEEAERRLQDQSQPAQPIEASASPPEEAAPKN